MTDNKEIKQGINECLLTGFQFLPNSQEFQPVDCNPCIHTQRWTHTDRQKDKTDRQTQNRQTV